MDQIKATQQNKDKDTDKKTEMKIHFLLIVFFHPRLLIKYCGKN